MRASFLKVIFFSASICLFTVDFSFAEENSIQILKEEIDSIIQNSCLKKERDLGIKAFSLTHKDVLYQRNSKGLLIPASNAKLFTSAVALKVLGGEYQFLTTVSTDGELKNGVLHGNLYLKGYGDPRLVSEELWMIVKDIRNKGIKQITGNIIADDTFFDNKLRGVGVEPNPGPEAYKAKISALSLNFNTVEVFVDLPSKLGGRPIITVDPPTQYIKISNNGVAGKTKGKRKKLIVGRTVGKGYDTVTVKGQVRFPGYHVYLAVSNPSLYTATVFKEFLEKEGIETSGEIIISREPEKVKIIVTHKSRPLALILQDINKISNNFIAEQVLKTMGGEKLGPPGTTEKGLTLVGEFLKSLGYGSSSYTLVDGSGLSKQNRISPDQIIDVLKTMYHDFSVRAEYSSSLGVMGVDGSLQDRLKNFPKKRYIRAKTGTLNGSNSLSGYIGADGGEEIAFSILVNTRKCFNGDIMKIQNSIVTQLVNFSRKTRKD